MALEPLEQRQLLSVNPLGSESLVNTFTAGTQRLYESGNALAASPSGDYIVTWSSSNQDGNGSGVYAQRFLANGDPVGTEFCVHSSTGGDQQRSSVAVSPSGAVVVWESYGQDGDHSGVFAQRFDSSGQPIGAEFQANATTLGYQGTPTSACLAGGQTAIIWAGKGTGDVSGIFGRLYDSAGNPLSNECLINSETAYQQQNPAVAALPDGGFLVAWESCGNADGDASGVYVQRLDATGTRVGGPTLVNTTIASFQQYPAIGVGPQGEYCIAWESYLQDGSEHGIYARRYSSSGQRAGSEFAVNAFTENDQVNPSVTFNDHGGMAIAYNGKGPSDNAGVWVREFGPDGIALGVESPVNATTAGTQQYPTVVAAGSGYVVAWSGARQRGLGRRLPSPPRLWPDHLGHQRRERGRRRAPHSGECLGGI